MPRRRMERCVCVSMCLVCRGGGWVYVEFVVVATEPVEEEMAVDLRC